ncbi:MAG: NADH-quinone oxidoreductase subunit N [Candidatus Marinimicrobia bacterium]|jgi:NADH-quinone oxidoreductase subunit N|nr:NADH-quinone oxidoreductase subunit N [Candidatus Neomarinimicrobiota bacterium]MDP6789077.1 NADH-quinone oxidoreductase subunit N [Candidatus Neomarinimicrobiota bacterium]
MSNLHSLSHYWPELILTATILIGIIADLFYKPKDSGKTMYWIFGGLALTAFAVKLLSDSPAAILFMGTLAHDPFAWFFKMLIVLGTVIVLLMSGKSSELKNQSVGEYYVLIGIMVFGMFLMVSSIDMIMVYLAIEIVSLMSFILAGYLKNDKSSNEASLKYVIYGGFSSGIMLYGFSILFGLTGTTKLYEIGPALATLDGTANFAIMISAIFILAGFGYKISAVPFHFWTPDVYEGSPTPVTAYLSVAPKAAGFALLIRFFSAVFGTGENVAAGIIPVSSALPWPQILAILAVMTMTLGNLVAIQQESVKRMLAYSSIAHAGYMLMGLPMLSADGISAVMVYLVMYLFMNLGAFFIVMVVQAKMGGDSFSDFSGLGWEMPLLGVAMTLFMFSLTGIPPTAGFIGKYYLFAAVIQAGPSFYWLAFAGAVNSVISLYYYIRVIRQMYLEGERSETIQVPAFMTSLIILVLAIPTLVFGVYWAPIADWVSSSMVFAIPSM